MLGQERCCRWSSERQSSKGSLGWTISELVAVLRGRAVVITWSLPLPGRLHPHNNYDLMRECTAIPKPQPLYTRKAADDSVIHRLRLAAGSPGAARVSFTIRSGKAGRAICLETLPRSMLYGPNSKFDFVP